ncbi:MAG: replication-associated recombination protein A [Victivallales bacterium]|nr:replication-associated recombination protein A [Victivallales bacterium]
MQQFDLAIDGPEDRSPAELSATGSCLPLAARMRPRSLEEYAGQRHLLADGKLLRRAIDADQFTSIIFSGPPGIGKTTLAELIAQNTNSEFVRLSGVTSSVADIRREISYAVQRRQISGRKTILFIDEIHRFNKAQQDVLLPDVENGNVRLVGATTENPFFYVNRPLLSRSMLFQLEPLDNDDIVMLLRRAGTDSRGFPDRKVELADDAAAFLANICEGDARKALSALELAVMTTTATADGITRITLAIAEASIQKKAVSYGDDGHYDTASAFIKSMRGSDPDAAVYWLAKMLHAGEDINFIARRIVIFASEDIGNADPRALTLAVNAMQAIQMIGLPEAKLILAQAVTYCATAPKSNASYKAIEAALKDIAAARVQPVPVHLRDAHSAGGKAQGHGTGYLYPHDFNGGFVNQDYLGIARTYYRPVDTGYESKIRERLHYWRQCRKETQEDTDDRQ